MPIGIPREREKELRRKFGKAFDVYCYVELDMDDLEGLWEPF